MNICFLSYYYPNKFDTSSFVFVKQLVEAVASKGHHCHVIAPFNVTHYRRLVPSYTRYEIGKGEVHIYSPGYLSLSEFKIGKFKPSVYFHKRAVQCCFKMLKEKPDVVYGHFWESCYEGYSYAKANKLPLFVACGESELDKMFEPKEDMYDFFDYVKGVICVSGKTRDDSVRLGFTTLDKCGVFPNSINNTVFFKRNREECRRILGFQQDSFIIAFVGWFIERKGSARVSAAIEKIGGVNSIFIGEGEQEPNCDGILFKGKLNHSDIPLYLSAANCFVLPTLQEGCCNAIVEAMACGLPIVSSNLPFNWDVLDKSNSIMVDPTDVDEIAEAVRELRDNTELRSSLSEGALKKAEQLTIDKRAEGILRFISDKINN